MAHYPNYIQKAHGCSPDAVGNYPCDNGAVCDACMLITTPDSVDKQSALIDKALKIIERRSNDEHRTVEARIAYGAAIDMIRYALAENEECLNQFDY